MTGFRASLRQPFVHPVFWACLILALGTFAYIFVSGKNTRPIASDGWGYYLYLPATFIYRDLSFSFLNSPDLPREIAQYRLSDGQWQGLRPTETGYRDKYAVGAAVLQLPFFLIALGFAKLTLPSFTGFEFPFQLSNAVSGAFYFAFGCYLSYRAARLRYGPGASLAALGFVVLATNLLHYATFEPGFSHIYGFCLIAGLTYLTVRRIEMGEGPPLWEYGLFGLLIGAAVMVRPTNAVVAFLYLPFVASAGLSQKVRGTLLSFAAAVVAALPQMLVWLETSGQLIYYSYVGEGFKFLQAPVGSYLLSVQKGLFFWHPAYLVMIVALVRELGVHRFEATIFLIIVTLNIYVGASWDDPTFGDSFGCRQIIEMNPLLMLPLVSSFTALRASRWRWAVAGLASFLIVVNALQFYGYMSGTIPHNHTTWEQYRGFWSDLLGNGRWRSDS